MGFSWSRTKKSSRLIHRVEYGLTVAAELYVCGCQSPSRFAREVWLVVFEKYNLHSGRCIFYLDGSLHTGPASSATARFRESPGHPIISRAIHEKAKPAPRRPQVHPADHRCQCLPGRARPEGPRREYCTAQKHRHAPCLSAES